jgi:hypothetical protein
MVKVSSINAQITATSIETKLTLYSFATSKSKTCVAFLTIWRNLIYNLEQINKFPLPDHQKSIQLKSAVCSHPQLKLFLEMFSFTLVPMWVRVPTIPILSMFMI